MDRQLHRMLLVEDHPETRHLLSRILALILDGWEVAEAATLDEGLAQLDPPPTCVLLDLELPDGDGEVILRRLCDDRLPTRVIVSTATDDPAHLDAVAEMGRAVVLRKPLDSEGLRRIRRAAMESSLV